MSKLILTLDGAFLGEFPLKQKYLTIGRRETNDIQIDNLAVSGEHARVITVSGGAVLEDLGSTNGSTVNGHAAHKQPLQHGDIIGIGKYELRYVNEAALGAGGVHPTDFENTILVQPASPEGDSVMSDPEDQPADSALVPAHIQILSGPAVGKELPLTKTLTTLGKPGVQVAVITRRPNGYYITHVEGKESPGVNGTPIGMQAHLLQDHDVIELAGTKMEFYLAEQ